MKSKILILLAALLPFTLVIADQPLVNTEWLAANLNNPNVRVVEVSVNPGIFEQGHIPGAVNLRWHTDLVDTVRRDLVAPERFAQLLSEAGVTADTRVVLYGDNNNWFAAWGAWVFNQFGHDRVSLLDGGRKKWELERRPLSTVPVSHRRTEYQITQPRPELRARLADVLAVVEGTREADLIDIRSADEFNGRVIAPAGVQELAVRAGHIPGAVNVPWHKAVNEHDGSFRSVEELRALYAEAGVDGSRPIITYCRIGERSSHTWFLLKHLLGYEVRNYDGSWTEYGNAVGVPITNPAGRIWTGT
ncbi:MAG: sulfurtransferase [Wenzhouxiangella sp.]|nr:sulfurtransferase [Wenzhouxiangella sp.]MCH8476538.1 sulfurtransferase [Wenzhouxiangella sp.]TVR98001.1 MAG: sulfurtransferase [Wenzhouxiangellaceae bacterium]